MVVPASASPPTGNPQAFEGLVDRALDGRAATLASSGHALDLGLDARTLVRYAACDVSQHERHEIEHIVLRNDWARDRVIALVKGARDPSSPAAHLLAAARQRLLPPNKDLVEALSLI